MYKQTYAHVFEVLWSGHFPIDMLRYDQCYPQDPGTIAAMTDESKDPKTGRFIHVCSKKDWQPAFERWNSFGCRAKLQCVIK